MYLFRARQKRLNMKRSTGTEKIDSFRSLHCPLIRDPAAFNVEPSAEMMEYGIGMH